MKNLFIPSVDYFSNKFTYLKDKFSVKFGYGNYLEMFNALKSMGLRSVDFKGYIDISIWDKYLPTLQGFVRGFFYFFMVIFNLKMIIWLVRGGTPIKDDNREIVGGRSSRW